MKYRFIESCAEHLSVAGLCSYLNVARSGYYKWLKQEPSQRARDDEQLGTIIEAEFNPKGRSANIARRMAVRGCVTGYDSWVGDMADGA